MWEVINLSYLPENLPDQFVFFTTPERFCKNDVEKKAFDVIWNKGYEMLSRRTGEEITVECWIERGNK